MRILVHRGTPALRHHRRGIVAAFQTMGDEVLLWDPDLKPAFDIFEEWDPEVYCGCRADHPRAALKCLDRYHPRVVMLEDIAIAGDTINFGSSSPRVEWRSEVAHVGDCTPEALGRVLGLIGLGRRVKICGEDGSWPIPEYLGPIRDESISILYASADRVMTLGDAEVATQAILSGSRPLEEDATPAMGTYIDRVASLYRAWNPP